MFSFSKMQGTGNDFVVINCIENKFEYSLPILSEFLCNRHYGVGADGVIYIFESTKAKFKMRIFNKDGTEAEMCGNGIRCLAKYVFEKKLVNKKKFIIETLAGMKEVGLNFENKKISTIEVNMGKSEISDLRYIIEIDNVQYKIYPVLIGNPHAICFVNDVEKFEVKKIGEIIQNYKYFPNKTNVEFVQIIDRKNIKVRVFERGVGETESCGTGACASAIIAMDNKYVDNDVNVKLNGGELRIKYNKDNKTIYLIGPAENIFDGKINM